jgi:hypothetical protein
MTFFDMFLIFSLLIIGLYHEALGVSGIISGASLVYPMPYMIHRPALYVLVVGVLSSNWIHDNYGAPTTVLLLAIVLADLAYEMIRPLIAPTVQIVGASPADVEHDLKDAFSKLDVRYTGTYPAYRVLEPRAWISVRYRSRQGVGEVMVSPPARKDLLESISRVAGKDRDAVEEPSAQNSYLLVISVGLVLMVLAGIRIATLIA